MFLVIIFVLVEPHAVVGEVVGISVLSIGCCYVYLHMSLEAQEGCGKIIMRVTVF